MSFFTSGDGELDGKPCSGLPLFVQVQQCPRCLYASDNISEWLDGAAALITSGRYQTILNDIRYPQLSKEFQAAAYLNEQLGKQEQSVAQSLRAIWACREMTRKKHRLRIQQLRDIAIERFQQLHASESELHFDYQLPLIDLLRCSGRFEEAIEAAQRTQQQWPEELFVHDLTAYQIQLCQEGDTNYHLIKESGVKPTELFRNDPSSE